MTESSIQSLIRMALSPYGVVFRTNSGEYFQGTEIYSPVYKQNILINLRRIQGLPKGFSDLIYYGYDGRAGFIEVKKQGENLKPEQSKFLTLMQSYGYITGVAHSDQEAIKIINSDFLNSNFIKEDI
jgi:hypothetical protein